MTRSHDAVRLRVRQRRRYPNRLLQLNNTRKHGILTRQYPNARCNTITRQNTSYAFSKLAGKQIGGVGEGMWPNHSLTRCAPRTLQSDARAAEKPFPDCLVTLYLFFVCPCVWVPGVNVEIKTIWQVSKNGADDMKNIQRSSQGVQLLCEQYHQLQRSALNRVVPVRSLQ